MTAAIALYMDSDTCTNVNGALACESDADHTGPHASFSADTTWTDDDAFVGNIVATFERATDAMLADGADWYPAMFRIMREHAALTSLSVAQCAAIYAATSINTPWARNLALAAQAIAEGGLHAGTLTMVRNKVNAIINGADIDATLSADADNLKLKSFARNLSGDYDTVTVDRWAHRVATAGMRSDVPSGDRYRRIADAYRVAARMCNVDPATMQAVTWVVQRGKAD
jgi:hypothetical protein